MKPTTSPQLLSITILVLLWLTAACSAVRPLHPAAAPPPYVVLKLDDACYENGFIHPGWTLVFDYLNEQDIVATIGIIGERMQEGSSEFYSWPSVEFPTFPPSIHKLHAPHCLPQRQVRT